MADSGVDQRFYRQCRFCRRHSRISGAVTDFRYWIQAGAELAGSDVELHREGEIGVPALDEWLASTLPEGATVGFDGRTVFAAQGAEWISLLADRGIGVRGDLDLIDSLWIDRPPWPKSAVVELDDNESGESRQVRLRDLRAGLDAAGADTWIGVPLDSTAWLLNVRGSDIRYNPVVMGYFILTSDSATWYTEISRLPDTLSGSLAEDGVVVLPYDRFYHDLSSLKPASRVLIDSKVVTQRVVDLLPDGVALRKEADPVTRMKSTKNPVQIARIRRAMEKDGIAFVRFLMNLENQLTRGDEITETEAAEALRAERSAIPGFLEESFSTIPAVGEHSAICHYEARPGSEGVLRRSADLFLIDSGGQWEEGTTDITRTVALGPPSQNHRRDYTLVLKSHIVLSRLRFPAGARGYQLDAVARSGLWSRGIDFGHGVGHGVGYRLNVHEGPQALNTKPIDVPIQPGMIVSNEPGIYREGRYGIRIENLLVCREDGETEFGPFLAFDTLTLAPYDRSLIDPDLLDETEIAWVDGYHRRVRDALTPLLEEFELPWLEETTAPLSESALEMEPAFPRVESSHHQRAIRSCSPGLEDGYTARSRWICNRRREADCKDLVIPDIGPDPV